MSKRNILWVGVLVALAGTAGVWWHLTASPSVADQWIAAVRQDNPQRAVECANKLIGSTPPPKTSHKQLMQREGIKPRFLSAPFNRWDYLRWRSALFFQYVSDRIVRGKKDPVEALFQAVVERIAAREAQDINPSWPSRIWQRQVGLCDRQAWVFCVLASQQGWETQIVYLRAPDTGVSHHTIAEIRKGDRVCTADPFKDVLIEGYSVAAVASHAELLQDRWPGSKKLWPEFSNAILWTPAYPQDYAPRNQLLYQQLKSQLGEQCPRFGVPPDQRMKKYQFLRTAQNEATKTLPMRLWFYPFRLLRETMQKSNQEHGG